MQSITILGSTGSIGVQALDVVAMHRNRFSIFALTANRNVDLLFQQCQQYHPTYAVLVDKAAAYELSRRIKTTQLKTIVLAGQQSLLDVVEANEVDMVLSAIVGAVGLVPTWSAVCRGKRILLANKEPLVMAGELIMPAITANQASLLPIDSEHNAVFQCLPSGFMPGLLPPVGVRSITLTASGGPFREMDLAKLSSVTPEQAIAHPNWSMGKKISVDSATMMNKGLEVIEAHWLFAMSSKDINVIVHPQSIIHAFVHYEDGTVLSHLASPDMHIPIAYALAWPDRIDSGAVAMDLTELSQAEFYLPDMARYPCLALAYQALEAGGTATTILNAANEVAVSQFLNGNLRFDQITKIISETLDRMTIESVDNLESILVADTAARHYAVEIIRTNKTMASQ